MYTKFKKCVKFEATLAIREAKLLSFSSTRPSIPGFFFAGGGFTPNPAGCYAAGFSSGFVAKSPNPAPILDRGSAMRQLLVIGYGSCATNASLLSTDHTS